MYMWKYKNIGLRNLKEASKVIGVGVQWLSNICTRRNKVKKVIAYCIVKYIDKDAEIEDYFERVGD